MNWLHNSVTSAPNAQHLGLGIVRQQPPGALADLPRAMQDTVLDTPLTSPSQDSVAYFEPFGRVSPPPSSHGLLASSSVPAMPPASGPHVHNKIQAAYGLMESALAEMKPQQAYGSQPTQKIAALEKAMSQFKDNFLDQGASESLPASASHSPTLSKGDKKVFPGSLVFCHNTLKLRSYCSVCFRKKVKYQLRLPSAQSRRIPPHASHPSSLPTQG